MLISWWLTPAVLLAQGAGTIDRTFGIDGKITIEVTAGQRLSVIQAFQMPESTTKSEGEGTCFFLAESAENTEYYSSPRFLQLKRRLITEYWRVFAPNFDPYKALPNADQSICLLGSSFEFSPPRLAVMKITPDGITDPGFGNQGTKIIDEAPGRDEPGGIMNDPSGQDNGSLYVIGTTYPGTYDQKLAIWKLDRNGMPDLNYGTGGRMAKDVPAMPLMVNDIIRGPDCWIAAGTAGEDAWNLKLTPSAEYPFQINPLREGSAEFVMESRGLCKGNHWIISGGVSTPRTSGKPMPYFDKFSLKSDGVANFDNRFGDLLAENLISRLGGPIVKDIPYFFYSSTDRFKSTGDSVDMFIAAGTFEDSSGHDQAFVTAFDSDGELIETFGDKGLTTLPLEGDCTPGGLILASDGFIYVPVNDSITSHIFCLFGPSFSSGIPETLLPEPSIRIYPNPSTRSLRIETAGIPDGPCQLTIADCQGRILYSGHQEILSNQLVSPGPGFENLLQPGIYLIRLASGNSLLTERIIRL